jgi:hypothetical protein
MWKSERGVNGDTWRQGKGGKGDVMTEKRAHTG